MTEAQSTRSFAEEKENDLPSGFRPFNGKRVTKGILTPAEGFDIEDYDFADSDKCSFNDDDINDLKNSKGLLQ
ncbi:hypothetical protein AB6A40_009098 [Gnathostoma spinigerum]|uniref:DFDF domain-containing protein n=1 Tax=Gnathostoma spinigerum TaxID=75299 RepID=A0ABD6EW21_9BILA